MSNDDDPARFTYEEVLAVAAAVRGLQTGVALGPVVDAKLAELRGEGVVRYAIPCEGGAQHEFRVECRKCGLSPRDAVEVDAS